MADYVPIRSVVSGAQFQTLYTFHLVALVVHAVQAAVLTGLAATASTRSVTVSFVRYNAWDKTAAPYTQYDLSQLSLAAFPPVFIGLAALDHLICVLAWDSWYRRALSQGTACVRWCEYAISASLMNVDILLLSNGLDILQIVAVFSLTAICMFFGAIVETTEATTTNRSLAVMWFAVGFAPFLAAWGIIFVNFTSASPPTFVYAITIGIVLIQSLFAVNLLTVRLSTSLVDRFYYAEIGWIVLSLVAKTFLAWIQYGGSTAQ